MTSSVVSRNVSILLSPNLTLGEFLATAHREWLEENWNPPEEVLFNAKRHATELWQPVRDLLGPIQVTSGYRCPGLNAAVGGAGGSPHIHGLATDNWPKTIGLIHAFKRIADSDLPFDRLIFEYGRWIHLASPRQGEEPRRQLLMKWPNSPYVVWQEADPRVQATAPLSSEA